MLTLLPHSKVDVAEASVCSAWLPITAAVGIVSSSVYESLRFLLSDLSNRGSRRGEFIGSSEEICRGSSPEHDNRRPMQLLNV